MCLRPMCKAGFRPLLWAIVLLFFMMYVIAVFTTGIMGQNNRFEVIQHEELFTSVPRSMVTIFRCSTADCTTPQEMGT